MIWLINEVLSIGLFVLAVFLYVKSPAFAWLFKIALLILWGAMTVGVVGYYVLFVYLPSGQYLAAGLGLFSGAFICALWLIAGLPELIKTARSAKEHAVFWQ